MDVLRARSMRVISNTPGRLYRALPAVLLGTLFNILDAVSTGLLLFPSEEGAGPTQFKSLQIQGVSMYIMSGILSQIAMTLGGSRFPGGLGAMLIEILPFLQGIGNDLRGALGADNPALVPTVMAAYALTSFLTGFVFIVLGVLKLGNVVAYFPQTVLTGAVGAIGLSLFILGLGLMLPESSPLLTLSSARSVLFSFSHLPLLAASFVPAFMLSLSKRSRVLARLTRGATHHAYFIPASLCFIPIIFWVIAGSMHTPQETLIVHGWLFRVDVTAAQQSGIGTSWIYWREFDFPRVEWWALKHAIANIVLLVVIGVLNLPIFVPALAFSLDVPYDMNHEFLGQGIANLLSGVTGTVPNILQYSYSVFITRANGGRFEMAIVTGLTCILFFTSSLLLPYVPTVLASALVLFLGIELLLEAVWESAQTLVLLEWGVVMTTLFACTFLGFAEGFGVGIGTATAVYLVYGVVDSRARVIQWEEWNETHCNRGQSTSVPIYPLSHMPSANTLSNVNRIPDSPDIETAAPSLSSFTQESADDLLLKINARVVVLSGYVFFASIPSLEMRLLDPKAHASFIIVDMTSVHRLETAAAQCFDRGVRDLTPRSTAIILCGVQKGSGVHADFERAGITLVFDPEFMEEKAILAFGTRDESVAWCQQKYEESVVVEIRETKGETLLVSNNDVYEKFCRLFDFDIQTSVKTHTCSERTNPPADRLPKPTVDVERIVSEGARFVCYTPQQLVTRQNHDRIIFIVEGQANIVTTASALTRPSLSRMLMMLPKESLQFVKRRLFTNLRSVRIVGPGDVLECCSSTGLEHTMNLVAQSRCVTVEIGRQQVTSSLMSWAKSKNALKITLNQEGS
ncbi:sulfate transporter family-domain-containing protein [Collybia nuda]|uniref:Sulfate transporter family-domain-containing protein n=1 Tax=Collybia nuda TaxID=64659 RepID=A0A9P5YFT2_9AGAR|nr:sulfate transporter family-domain-containing protein [Collybia nuda]